MSPTLRAIASRHARARMQQRGIPSERVETLLRFGHEHHDGRGGVILCLDAAARRRAERSGGAPPDELDRLRGLYLVLTPVDTIATVGHQTRRLRRH